ncbi:MAG: helix-turn-helix domain-containing protein, partial [Eubacteriales bacterium]
KQLREAKKFSQSELGRRIGVSSRTIASYEAGHSYPKQRDVYDRLAKELDVDVNYLRTENEDFMEDVAEKYGRRGVLQAKEILEQTAQLFAGGTLSDDDEIAFMAEMQRLYLDSKIRAKKYTPKKYLNLQDEQPDDE